MGKEDEEVNLYACGEVSLGEHWFNQETTSAERWAMFRLEREMDATLMNMAEDSRLVHCGSPRLC